MAIAPDTAITDTAGMLLLSLTAAAAPDVQGTAALSAGVSAAAYSGVGGHGALSVGLTGWPRLRVVGEAHAGEVNVLTHGIEVSWALPFPRRHIGPYFRRDGFSMSDGSDEALTRAGLLILSHRDAFDMETMLGVDAGCNAQDCTGFFGLGLQATMPVGLTIRADASLAKIGIAMGWSLSSK